MIHKEHYLEIISKILKENPKLTINGFGYRYQSARRLFMLEENTGYFNASVDFFGFLLPDWTEPEKTRDIRRSLFEYCKSDKHYSKIKDVPLGIVYAAALYLGCTIQVSETAPHRQDECFITPPARTSQGGK